jgi:hypothetical protein
MAEWRELKLCVGRQGLPRGNASRLWEQGGELGGGANLLAGQVEALHKGPAQTMKGAAGQVGRARIELQEGEAVEVSYGEDGGEFCLGEMDSECFFDA